MTDREKFNYWLQYDLETAEAMFVKAFRLSIYAAAIMITRKF
jgi:hypothetical protein